MRNYINHVQLVGHLGADPEIKTFDSGSTKVNCRLATNESYKDKEGNYQTKTFWHNIIAWGAVGQSMANQLSKGSHVLITGRIETRNYENKEGHTQYVTEIIAGDYMNLSYKKKAEDAEVSV